MFSIAFNKLNFKLKFYDDHQLNKYLIKLFVVDRPLCSNIYSWQSSFI